MAVDTSSPPYYDPFDPALDPHVHEVWARLREDHPVWFNERYGFYVLSRFDDVWAALVDTATFSSTHGVMPESLDEPIGLPLVIFMDPPEHDAMRRLVSRAFTPKRVAELEAHVGELVDGYLDPLVGEPAFDYVEQFAALLPPMVIGHMLGVAEEERDPLRRWFDDMLHHEPGELGPSARSLAAMGELAGYLEALVDERRRRPGDDMVSVLLDSEVEEGGEARRLTPTEVVSFVMLLAGAGVETVARLLSWAAVLLADHPDQRRLLVDDPSLVPGAIEELLRYEAPSPVNGRFTLRPSTFQGVELPAGSKVLLLNGSANRDPREFDDPERFDVRRKIKRHVAFGYGTHYCLGAALARLEARVALTGTLARFPTWEVDHAGLVRVQTTTVRGYSSVPIRVG